MKRWEIEHQIYMLQHYGPVVAAAGINPERLDSFAVGLLAGAIDDDDEVMRLCREVPDPPMLRRDKLDDEFDLPARIDFHKLTLQVLQKMNATSRELLAARVLRRCSL